MPAGPILVNTCPGSETAAPPLAAELFAESLSCVICLASYHKTENLFLFCHASLAPTFNKRMGIPRLMPSPGHRSSTFAATGPETFCDS